MVVGALRVLVWRDGCVHGFFVWRCVHVETCSPVCMCVQTRGVVFTSCVSTRVYMCSGVCVVCVVCVWCVLRVRVYLCSRVCV